MREALKYCNSSRVLTNRELLHQAGAPSKYYGGKKTKETLFFLSNEATSSWHWVQTNFTGNFSKSWRWVHGCGGSPRGCLLLPRVSLPEDTAWCAPLRELHSVLQQGWCSPSWLQVIKVSASPSHPLSNHLTRSPAKPLSTQPVLNNAGKPTATLSYSASDRFKLHHSQRAGTDRNHHPWHPGGCR